MSLRIEEAGSESGEKRLKYPNHLSEISFGADRVAFSSSENEWVSKLEQTSYIPSHKHMHRHNFQSSIRNA